MHKFYNYSNSENSENTEIIKEFPNTDVEALFNEQDLPDYPLYVNFAALNFRHEKQLRITTRRNAIMSTTISPEILTVIPTFSGQDEKYSVDDFIDQIENHKEIGKWTEDITCRIAKTRLLGKAARIFRANPQTANFTTWNEMKEFLKNRINPHISSTKADYNFVACTQQQGEVIDEFAFRFSLAAEKAKPEASDPSEAPALKKFHEGRKLEYFINGVKGPLQQFLITAKPKTYSEAVQLAREHEAKLRKNGDMDIEELIITGNAASSEKVQEKTQKESHSEGIFNTFIKKMDELKDSIGKIEERQKRFEEETSRTNPIAGASEDIYAFDRQNYQQQGARPRFQRPITHNTQKYSDTKDENPLAVTLYDNNQAEANNEIQHRMASLAKMVARELHSQLPYSSLPYSNLPYQNNFQHRDKAQFQSAPQNQEFPKEYYNRNRNRKTICAYCNKIGHYMRICRTKQRDEGKIVEDNKDSTENNERRDQNRQPRTSFNDPGNNNRNSDNTALNYKAPPKQH